MVSSAWVSESEKMENVGSRDGEGLGSGNWGTARMGEITSDVW